jgi:hypothetical protein
MANFNDLPDTRALAHLHGDTIVVLVEGKSDVDFLKRMFPGMDGDIRFEDAGGCTGVKRRLEVERTGNPKVYGLLDRDTLKREMRWDELFDVDNDNFRKTTWSEGLYVLTRWEIENYLFDISALYRLFRNWRSNEFTDEEALLDRMIESALEELHITAGWCTAHKNGFRQENAPSPWVDAGTMEDQVRKWIARHAPTALTEYDGHLARVKLFDAGSGVGKRERLAALLRMVDGKRLLDRIKRWLGNIGRNEDGPAFQLADNISSVPQRSDDLFEVMNALRRRA